MTVTKTEPSAPPLEDDEIPVVAATAIPAAANFAPTASATAYVPDNMPPAANPPPGMSMVTKTVTYPDGRKVTTTEYAPNTAPPAPAPRAATTQHHPPRRDLGSRSCSVSCPYCQHTGLTKTSQQCAVTTLSISVETAVKLSVGVGLIAATIDS
eukprot:scaffold13205_cov113-Skeletonema_dohrnii-CCMP3373.AAC.4